MPPFNFWSFLLGVIGLLVALIVILKLLEHV